jgi:MFS transporter, SP family, arabinose:H+ symporter
MQNRSPLYYTMIVSLGGFLFGFDASVISGGIVYLDALFELSSLSKGWIVSAPAFSAMFAMLGGGVLSDRIGRKKTLQIVAFCYVLSALLSAISQDIGSLVAARMLGGVAFGGALIIVPVYISEISPSEQRGRLVSIQQMNIVVGFLAAYFSNYFIGVYLAEWLSAAIIWRWMLAVELVPAIIYVALLPKIPESPVWLMSRSGLANKRRPADTEAASLRTGPSVYGSFLNWLMYQKKHLYLLWSPTWRQIFLVAVFLGILQQITGINAIFFYATSIFEKTGIGIDASLAQTVSVGVINIIFTLVAFFTIDRFGRRFLLLWGLVGMVISMSITAYGFANTEYKLTQEIIVKYEQRNEIRRISPVFEEMLGLSYTSEAAFKAELSKAMEQISWNQVENGTESDHSKMYQAILLESKQLNSYLVLLGILGFVASFACSLGPVMWVVLSEIFPTHLRGIGISIVGFLNSFTSWVTQFVFPIELNIIGDGFTYAIFAGIAAIGWGIVYRYLPETKGNKLGKIR